jgi:hypothetical protein
MGWEMEVGSGKWGVGSGEWGVGGWKWGVFRFTYSNSTFVVQFFYLTTRGTRGVQSQCSVIGGEKINV